MPSSREDIDKDSPWNQEVLKNIPEIVVRSFMQFLVRKLLHNEELVGMSYLLHFLVFDLA